MFPDSAIAKRFGCGHTTTAAIIKGALAQHYLNKVLIAITSNPFLIMMDESDDNSYIILVRVLRGEKFLHGSWTCQLSACNAVNL